ncbi:hypothetical protein [Acetivibrio straminisolvens]|jgi:hypothetical protein|uniref:hypothetical protein n=1 Tax=Acetivibrio straminisolvens TaxID=253314 RepID=UPI00223EDA9B|nr:hypothetical protein [Acetivibrio straminisolvens]
MNMKMNDKIEKVLWSIAFPGLGQLLNGHIIKGIFFMILELIVNHCSNLNSIIIYSFVGNIQEAINNSNYQWLMFYPSLYLYVMWDAYKYAKGDHSPMDSLPYVFAAYLGTVGIVYSASFNINGIFFGPVWLTLIFMVIGIIIGCSIQKQINKRSGLNSEKK